MADGRFDILFMGGGPAGYVGAIRAAQLGYKTALVEENRLGGVCLNWGCIPTKALLQSAELYRNFLKAETFGVKTSGLSFDLQSIVRRSREVTQQLFNGVNLLLKKNNVTVFEGRCSLLEAKKVGVEKSGESPTVLHAEHIILATGSRPRSLPGIEPEGKDIWTSREALLPKEVPSSLVIVGAGAIGVEFACFYSAFGSKVTIVEILDQILPSEDKEIAEIARKHLESQGIKFYLKSKISDIKLGNKELEILLNGPDEKEPQNLSANKIIVAAGVVPNVENIGLENLGIKINSNGFIQVDKFNRTNVEGVYAIGDVSGAPCLAHKASHEAILCVEKIAGLSNVSSLNKNLIPRCVYSYPQIASVGLSESEAISSGYQIKIGRFTPKGNGKSIVLDEPFGLVKTIFDQESGELLGAHMVGADVTELIQGFVIAKGLETTEAELMHTVFAHPTLSEMIQESVLNAYGRAIHL